jgi:nicotinate-nucleotide pyrophosphorylase (carboxylating)
VTGQGIPDAALDTLIRSALAEDLGPSGAAEIRAKSPLVLAGLEAARRTFHALDPDLRFRAPARDGDHLGPGDTAAAMEGDLRAILAGERTALNFLQRLSGVATLTARFVEAVQGTRARILDTRKTAPGWRQLDKYAVRCGGGTNHRMGLYDAILIKENHLRVAGGAAKAVDRARRGAPEMPLEVEVRTIDELEAALAAGAGRILLDNMDPSRLREAVRRAGGLVPLEASGGITLENVRAVAESGVDFISIGALTHSAPAADLSLAILRP